MGIPNDVDELTGRSAAWDHIQAIQAKKLHPQKPVAPPTKTQLLTSINQQKTAILADCKAQALAAHQQNLLPLGKSSFPIDHIVPIMLWAGIGYAVAYTAMRGFRRIHRYLNARKIELDHLRLQAVEHRTMLRHVTEDLSLVAHRLSLNENSTRDMQIVTEPPKIESIPVPDRSPRPTRRFTRMPGDWNNNLLVYARPQDIKTPNATGNTIDEAQQQAEQAYSNPAVSGMMSMQSNSYTNITASGMVHLREDTPSQTWPYIQPQQIRVPESRAHIHVHIGTRTMQILRITGAMMGEERVIYEQPNAFSNYQSQEPVVVYTEREIAEFDVQQESNPIQLFGRDAQTISGPVRRWYRVRLRNGEVYETWH